MMHTSVSAVSFITLSVLVSLAGAQPVHETYKVTAFDGGPEDIFGVSVDIGQGYMVVGASGDDDNGRDAGAVYIYDVDTGNFIRKIKPADGEALDFFGRSVIDQKVVAVGATGDDDMGISAGAVYLFDLDTGQQLHKLHPNDAAQDEFFGVNLAMGQGIVVVSSINDSDSILNAAVYIFDVATGTQIHKLMPDVLDPNAWFGGSVAIDDGLVLVGVPTDSSVQSGAGSVYVFDTASGAQVHKLEAADLAAGDGFGGAVDIDQGIIAVGANRDDDFDTQTGSVYIFDAVSGSELRKITAFDAVEEDRFGTSVSIQDGVVAIGAGYDNEAFLNSGSVYLYKASTGEFIHKLNQSDPSHEDRFGLGVCFRENYVAVGMTSDDDLGMSSGAVYVFDFDCPADLNGDLSVDFFDISSFLGLYIVGDPAADLNEDGNVDFFDISTLISLYDQGCPL